MKFKVGDTAEISRTITSEDIRAFADVSGDHNPVHFDDEFARRMRFEGRIAHGMLTASLLSSAIGNQLPGPGTVYLGQALQFVAPVYPGDTITARVTVTSIREDKPILKLETVCVNQRNEPVLKGEATVLFRSA
jgi:3-hydroxybutyryl-CoA dehydratase